MKTFPRVLLVAMLILVGFVTPTQATIVYDSDGFEPPDFTAGLPLEGQDGWVRTGTTSASQVQIAVIEAGNQAVQITRAPNEDARWGVLTTGFPASPTDLISVRWDMNVLPSGLPSGSFGPFFGVEGYADAAGLTFLGSLGVDTATGEILYLHPVTGFTAVPSVTVPFQTWHMYELLFDFGSDTYDIFYDGALQVGGIPFTDGPQSTFSDAPIATVGAAGDAISQAAIGSGFFDNYVITAIPEPSAVLFGALVCACTGASIIVRRIRAGRAQLATE